MRFLGRLHPRHADDIGLHQRSLATVLGLQSVEPVSDFIGVAERAGYLTRTRMAGRPRCQHFKVAYELSAAAAMRFLDDVQR